MSQLLTVALILGAIACSVNASYAGTWCSGTGYIVDPSNCNIYYQCSNGRYEKHHCPSGLNFNGRGFYCDWPANSPCENTVVMPPTTTTTTTQRPTTTTTTTQRPTTTTTTTQRPTTTTTTTQRPTTTTTTTQRPTTTTTTKPPTTRPPTSGTPLISHAEFQSAAATKGGNPTSDYYLGFIASLPKAQISTRREAILFLAHATWETVGFIYTKEVYCQTHLADCLRAYPNNAGGLPGRVYYGRGVMQLTWDYNYRGASSYLYGDDRLLQNPDVVGEDPAVGWATGAWYWYANVHTRSQTFGSTLKAINGALECEGGSHGQNRYLRFMHYKEILTRLGEPHPADDDGWCTAW
ncbi:basic endochitinase CHB4 [Folsomia candida]|uniref:Chitinase 5 n=1 Tax=Folsomia candida TaxID=158441 RepID=A0A226EUZ7_FOLCA|nr:basic endochitinase CHB4 [Folsomia candida]OXA60894.1 Chitinase 5 [Folsomia candida]